MTEFDWYDERYSKYADETTCIHAIQYIRQFLSHYNDLYDRNLKSENVTDESPVINQAQQKIDELKILIQTVYNRIESNHAERIGLITEKLTKLQHVDIYNHLECNEV